MSLNASDSLYHSITKLNATSYQVCYAAPPHIVSDGLWGGHKNGRTPMKSFFPIFELQILIIFAITQIFRFILKPLRVPLFISQMMAGLIIGTSFEIEGLGTYMKMLFPYGTQDIISTISSLGLTLFIFINGVQMDFSMITRTGNRAWAISIIGLVIPIFIGFTLPALLSDKLDTNHVSDMYISLVSHTISSFAVIASLLNELCIQNSELGRLALSSALVSDVLSTFVASVGVALVSVDMKVITRNLFSLFSFAALIPLICRPAMFWIIKRTPEGRPVKDVYIYVIIAMVFGLGFVAVEINQEFVLGAFILGLSVPEGPPLGSALVKKLQFFGTSFFLPIYVTTCVLRTDFSLVYSSSMVLIIVLIVLFTHLVKIIACFLPLFFCNMPTTDALSVALILNTKGVVEIGLYCALYDSNLISGQLYGLMMISVVVIACIVQWSVKFLYDPSRKYASYHRRNIMSLRPHSELRILVSIHKPNHIGPMIDFLDLCYPTTEHPITVDVVHLIELVGRTLPLFIPHCLHRQVSGSQRSYSDDVILAFNIFEHDNQHAATINTYTAISPTHLMYEDVCHLALDKVASIIILPFHQRWSSDGAVLSDDKNIKTLNRKVLEIAPCSVGILVARGSQSSTIGSTTRLAIIYLGGEDDEEVLCLTKRATRNPEIDIVIYHLICKDYIAELEDLMVVGHDVLQDVKHAHNVRYQEIFTKDGSDTVAFLRDIVNDHDFFIVGRRHGINSPQTDGLTHWSEFPELGVIGDFLSSPDFKSHASILVVQQQLARKARRQGWKF